MDRLISENDLLVMLTAKVKAGHAKLDRTRDANRAEVINIELDAISAVIAAVANLPTKGEVK